MAGFILKIHLLTLLCVLFAAPARVRAADPLPATKPEHLDQKTTTDTGVRIEGMEVTFADYAALLRDFPDLRSLSPTAHRTDDEYLRDPQWRKKVDAAILEHFAYMSERQLALEGVRFTTSPQGARFKPSQTTTFYRPPGSNRASMIPFFGGLVNVKGNGNGGEDLFGSGTDVQSQVAAYEAISKLPDGPEKDRRLRELRTSDHRDGLMARHEGLAMEIATMRALQMQFDIENANKGTNHQTVSPYFLIEAPGSDNFFGARFSFVGRQAAAARQRVSTGSETLYADEHGGHQGTTSNAVIDAGGFKLLVDPKKHPKLAAAYHTPLLPADLRERGRTYDPQQGEAWKNASQNGEALAQSPLGSRQLAAYYLDVEKLGPLPLDAEGNPDANQLSTEQRKAYQDHGLLDERGEIIQEKLSPFQRDWIAAKKVLIDREKRAAELARLKLSDPEQYEALAKKEAERAVEAFNKLDPSLPLSERAERAQAVLNLSKSLTRTLLVKALESRPSNPEQRRHLTQLAADELSGDTGLSVDSRRNLAELLLSRAHPDYVKELIGAAGNPGELGKALTATFKRAAGGTLRLPVSLYEYLLGLPDSGHARATYLQALALRARQDPEALRVFAESLKGHGSSADFKWLESALDEKGKPAPLTLEEIAEWAGNGEAARRKAAAHVMAAILDRRTAELGYRPGSPLSASTRLAAETLLEASHASDPDVRAIANQSLPAYFGKAASSGGADREFLAALSRTPPRRAPAAADCRAQHQLIAAP